MVERPPGAQPRTARRTCSGPTARVTLDCGPAASAGRAPRSHRLGVADEIRRNPFWSIAARAIELIHAHGRGDRDRRRVPAADRAARNMAAPAGPRRLGDRGSARHAVPRYEVDERRAHRRARIVPPTSQNQAAIEADLTAFAPIGARASTRRRRRIRLEQLIRSYDPCISCATHFLDLSIEQVVT